MAPARRTREGTIRVRERPILLNEEWLRSGGPLEGGLRLAGPLTYDIADSSLPYLVVMTVGAVDGRLVCTALEVSQKRGGPPVTAEGLRRATVEAYIDRVRTVAFGSGHIALLAPVEGAPGAFEPATAPQRRAFESAHRARRPIDEVLPAVAAQYRAALRSPDPSVAKAPTAAVAQALHYSRGHASRLVTAARVAGLLDPARGPGRPGEVTKSTKLARARKKGMK